YEVSYPAGPRTTPVIRGKQVFTLGTMGDLLCLDTSTGKATWSRNFPKEFDAPAPFWGFSSHLLLDGDKLISLVGTKGNVGVAFHKDRGKEVWRALSVEGSGRALAHGPGYCPPMIYEIGGKRQLVVWHPAAVCSLDPETGTVYWSQPWSLSSGLSIPTPRLAG